jgi:hypothetical protein
LAGRYYQDELDNYRDLVARGALTEEINTQIGLMIQEARA